MLEPGRQILLHPFNLAGGTRWIICRSSRNVDVAPPNDLSADFNEPVSEGRLRNSRPCLGCDTIPEVVPCDFPSQYPAGNNLNLEFKISWPD